MCTNGRPTNSVKPPVSSWSVAGHDEVPRPRPRLLDRAEHDRDVAAQPDRVGGAVGLEPLVGRDLVGAEDGADVVVEDLGGGARQAAQPGVHEPAQVVGQRLAEALGALGDLEGGEAVDVDVGRGVLHGPGDVDVVVAVEARVDAALEADLGGAEVATPRAPARRCRRG